MLKPASPMLREGSAQRVRSNESWHFILCVALAGSFWMGWVRAAHADEPAATGTPGAMQGADAQAGFSRGIELFEAKDYSAAIEQFRRAYELEPGVEILFAWAQAERLRGNCAGATELYRKILEEGPTDRQERVTRTQLAKCEELLGKQHPLGPSEPADRAGMGGSAAGPTQSNGPAQRAIGDPDGRRSPWYKDWLGMTLLGTGTVGIGVGVLYFVTSQSEEDAARRARNSGEWQGHISDAESKRTVAWIALGSGAALIAGGIFRYLFRSPGSAEPRVTAWLGRRGGGLVWQQAY